MQKIVNIQELIVGDVFAKEIKLRGRQAYEVTEVSQYGEHLTALPRGKKDTVRISFKTYPQVYFLRNINN